MCPLLGDVLASDKTKSLRHRASEVKVQGSLPCSRDQADPGERPGRV